MSPAEQWCSGKELNEVWGWGLLGDMRAQVGEGRFMPLYLRTDELNPHWFTAVAVTKYSPEHLKRKGLFIS